MKQLASHSQQIGDKGSVQASLGVEGDQLVARAAIEYRQPLAGMVDKIMGPVDDLIMKLEKLIPGDQVELAKKAQIEAREQIVKLLSEPKAEPAQA